MCVNNFKSKISLNNAICLFDAQTCTKQTLPDCLVAENRRRLALPNERYAETTTNTLNKIKHCHACATRKKKKKQIQHPLCLVLY